MSTNNYWRNLERPSWEPASWAFGGLAPSVDVRDDETSICIMVELAGVDKNDIELYLENDVLIIRGEKKPSLEERRGNFFVMERAYGSFRRSITLPDPIDEQQVKATFEDGLLSITLPKCAPKQARKVPPSGD